MLEDQKWSKSLSSINQKLQAPWKAKSCGLICVAWVEQTSGYWQGSVNMYIHAGGFVENMMYVHIGHLDFVIIGIQTGKVMHSSF